MERRRDPEDVRFPINYGKLVGRIRIGFCVREKPCFFCNHGARVLSVVAVIEGD